MKPYFNLFIFFIFLILLYLNISFIGFFFLVPLFLYLNKIKKIDYFIIILLIIFSSLINFWSIYEYGFYVIFKFILANLLLYLLLILLFKWFIKSKYNFIIIPSIFIIIYRLFKLLWIENWWFNFPAFWNIYSPLLSIIWSQWVLYIIILINVLIYNVIILDKKNKFINFIGLTFIIIIYFIPINNFKENWFIKIAWIQPNLEQTWSERGINKDKNVDLFLSMSLDAVNKYKPDIIVWPEYVFTHYVELDKNLLNIVNVFSLENHVSVIFWWPKVKWKEYIPNTSEYYNALYVFNEWKIKIYKSHKIVAILDGKPTVSNEYNKIMINGYSIWLILCYEEHFQDIFEKQIINNDAETFLIVWNQYYLSNYHWLKMSSIDANVRAVENNRFIFRLETWWLSTVINNKWKNIKNLEIKKEDILYSKIPLTNKKSFYTLYWYIIDIWLFIISLVIFIFFLIKDIYFNINFNTKK